MRVVSRNPTLPSTATVTTAVQVYTVHDIFPHFAREIVEHGAARHGACWHYCRPPVVDLEFEMDCRGILTEVVLPG